MPPLIHKKFQKRFTPSSHGRYECWISPDDGKVYEYYATSTEGAVSGYEGTPARPGRLAPGGVCHFDAEKMAGNAAYFIFQAIGGGAGGSYPPHEDGNAKYQGETGASHDITLTTTTSDPDALYYFSYKESLASAPDWVKDMWVPIPGNSGTATLCTGAWDHTWTDEDTTTSVPTVQPDGSIKYETVVIPGETHHESGSGKCIDVDLSKVTIGADDYFKITTDKGSYYSKVEVGNVAPCTIENDTVTDCAPPVYSAAYPSSVPTTEAQVTIGGSSVFPGTVTLKKVNEFDTPTFGYAGSPGAGVSMFLPSIKGDLSFELGAGGTAGTETSFKGSEGQDTIIKSGGNIVLKAAGGTGVLGGAAGTRVILLGSNTCTDTALQITNCLDVGVDSADRYSLSSKFNTVPELDISSKTASAIEKWYEGTNMLPGSGGDGGYSFIRDVSGYEKLIVYTDDTLRTELGYENTISYPLLVDSYTCSCYDWEAIGTNSLAQGSPIASGGKGAVASGSLIDSLGHIVADAETLCTSEDALAAESGNTLDFTHYPGAHACASGGQFKDKPYGFGVIYDDKGYLSLDPDGTFADCPNYNYTGTATISLPIAFFHKEVPLYYGKAGQTGAYKTIFARSLNVMGTLKMVPGRGGQPAAQSTLADEIYNSGEDGEDTTLSYNCETGTCLNTITAEGGKGGASHVLDEIAFRELTNEEIKNYSTGAAAITLEDTFSYKSVGEQSEFSKLGFLSSISNISNDAGELLSEILGKSGDGGYVTHHCWLQPQYFVYSADHVEIPNYPTSDYEGYTLKINSMKNPANRANQEQL